MHRDWSGKLSIRSWVGLSQDEMRLAQTSLLRVNQLIQSKQMSLTPSLRLVPYGQSDVRVQANGNWFAWTWFGYDAGMDTGRVGYVRSIAGRVLPEVQQIMRNLGYAPAATYLGWYVKGYSWYMNFMDGRGGRRGIQAVATWGNLWVPVIYSQR